MQDAGAVTARLGALSPAQRHAEAGGPIVALAVELQFPGQSGDLELLRLAAKGKVHVLAGSADVP